MVIKMKKILVIGSLNMDTTVQVEHTPITGETILAGKTVLNPGGKGANQAYAIGKIGGNVAMIGAVGQDTYGEKVRNNLASVGVDVSAISVRPTESTGAAFVMVNEDGDNSIVVTPGANATVDTRDIDENIDLMKESDIIIMQLEIPLETVMYAAKRAKGLGKKVILDPAPVPRFFPRELLPYIDILKPNETELSMLTNMAIDGEESLRKAALSIRNEGVKEVIVTLGKAGVYIDSEYAGKIRIPSPEVKVVDTTAAGDTFMAALAIKIAEEETTERACQFANQLSGIVVSREGAQSSVPSKMEIEQLFKES